MKMNLGICDVWRKKRDFYKVCFGGRGGERDEREEREGRREKKLICIYRRQNLYLLTGSSSGLGLRHGSTIGHIYKATNCKLAFPSDPSPSLLSCHIHTNAT